MPQSSMEHTSLKAVIDSTAHAAQSRGIVGYLSVDLLTFIHPETVCHSPKLSLTASSLFSYSKSCGQ